MKKVRFIQEQPIYGFKKGETYEVRSEYENENGKFYNLKNGFEGIFQSRFEDVIEPDFKVGDKVVFARESKGGLKGWNFVFEVGNTYTVKGIGATGNILASNEYYIDKECFELSPEPKPILQTNHSADWEKPEVKERATVKKVRCIDATYSGRQLESNKIYEIATEGQLVFGTKYYTLKGKGNERFSITRFEDVVEEKYPQIEEIFGDTIVFNPPYTIAKLQVKYGPKKGKWFIGKAKCNPNDTYDKWTGFKIAHQRMRESKPCSK